MLCSETKRLKKDQEVGESEFMGFIQHETYDDLPTPTEFFEGDFDINRVRNSFWLPGFIYFETPMQICY